MMTNESVRERVSLAAACLLALCAAATPRSQTTTDASASSSPTIDESLVEALGEMKRERDRTRVLDGMEAALDALTREDPVFGSAGPLLEALGGPQSSRKTARRQHRPTGSLPTLQTGEHFSDRALVEALPFPVAVEYAFGYAELVEVPVFGKDRRARQKAQVERDQQQLRAMLDGCPPQTDRILAAVLSRLDDQRAADEFAKLLEDWRNDGESFYRALDRTAGTDQSLFFYDVMLDDFVERCARDKDEERALRRSNKVAHDALHDAFLAYRQYRALREAWALSLLLPPDVPLPPALSRYEEQKSGLYSVRQIAQLVHAHFDGDLIKTCDFLVESTPPLRADLWATSHDPYGPLFAAWQKIVPEIAAENGDTDRLLETFGASRTAARARFSMAAHAAARGAGLGAGD